jgi:hypothetical protein
MSYATITQATNDTFLRNRIQAAVNKEAQANAELAATPFGVYVLDQPWVAYQALIWPVSIDAEAAYESAVIAGNPNPGGDPAVITDAQLLGAVQVNWPPDVPAFLPPVPPL